MAEDIPHIFEKFYRGRAPSPLTGGEAVEVADEVVEAPGVGLGLYLARTIIEEVGGRISVRSVVGRGSKFTISLPVWDNEESGLNGQESY
jgi:signal transduction histidine kinase